MIVGKRKNKWKKYLIGLVSIFFMIGIAFGIYVAGYYPAFEYPIQTVSVTETNQYIIYGNPNSETGFVFYPGALVEAESYAPILSKIAEKGICCIVIKMPFYLAVFNPNAANTVRQDFLNIEDWYIGGHSLGGAMAASYASQHEREWNGLVLLASYPTDPLKALPVLSIYGSEDKILNQKKYKSAIQNAASYTEIVIEGGNHAGFGYYGEQKGDGEATIAQEEQWEQTANYIREFMRSE